MSHLLICAVRIYRLCISPLLPPTCRFYPSCSQYALEAIQTYGALKGSWLAIRRLSKCHPYHPGGYDPLTDSDEGSESNPCFGTIDQ